MATIGTVKARLLVQVGGDPVEIGEFEIPLGATVAFGIGIGSIHVEERDLRDQLAHALEAGAKQLRSK